MTKTRWTCVGIAVALLASAAGSAAGGADTSAQVPPPPVVKVRVGDNFYKPKKLEVPAGTTISWKNVGRVNHNIVPNKGKKYGIIPMRPDKVYKYTFTAPGTYKYYCSLHGAPNVGQHGTIIVTAPPPLPTTAPPTT